MNKLTKKTTGLRIVPSKILYVQKKREQQDLEQTVDKNDEKQMNECKSIYGGVDKLLLFVLYTRRTLMSKYII